MTLESRAPWDFQVYRAPYANPESFESLFEGSETCLPDLLPTRGPILLGNLPRLDPNVQFTDLGWIQEAVPWMSLALRAPAGLERGLLASALTRVAKHGAVVLTSRCVGWRRRGRLEQLVRTGDRRSPVAYACRARMAVSR
jgi:hypothetical protein